MDPEALVPGDRGLIIPDVPETKPCDIANEFEVGGEVLLYPADGPV
jgi:hypothetical protein